ncbi:hypothetical protein NUACC21_61590 [Scytonema sp. NUACC21]
MKLFPPKLKPNEDLKHPLKDFVDKTSKQDSAIDNYYRYFAESTKSYLYTKLEVASEHTYV